MPNMWAPVFAVRGVFHHDEAGGPHE
jgi:hypothetical protein